MNKTSRSPIVLLIIDAILIVLAAGGFWWLGQEETRLVETAKSLIAAERKKESLARFLRIYDQTEGGRAKITSYFVSTETLPTFIERLEASAREAGIIYTLSDTHPSDTGGREVLDLTMATEGSFAQIFRFISILENLPYRLDINQAYLAPVTGGRWRANLSLTLLSFK